ncbi:MAG: hypothetical protein K8R90_05275 [Candidatus Cloacimonetes bacterium]|nr:hypothetical protein [Candidatus Cloacimonadota bacterium]
MSGKLHRVSDLRNLARSFQSRDEQPAPPAPRLALPDGYIENNPAILARIRGDLTAGKPMRYLFAGAPGAGKSYLARYVLAAWSKLLPVGALDQWIWMPRHAREYASYAASNGSIGKAEGIRRMERALRRPFTVLDDLGAERDTASARELAAHMIQECYEAIVRGHQTHIIVTTNLGAADVPVVYDERVADRIAEAFVIMRFAEKSFRQTKQTIIHE